MIRAFWIALCLEIALLIWLAVVPLPPQQKSYGDPALITDVAVVSVSDETAAAPVTPTDPSPAVSPPAQASKATSEPAAPVRTPQRNDGQEKVVSTNKLAATGGTFNSVQKSVGSPVANKVSTPSPVQSAKGIASGGAPKPGPSEPVSGDSLDGGVVVISGPRPVYPKHAAAFNIEKTVRVRIQVNPDGSVHSVTLLDGDDQWGFGRAVRTAVMAWRYRPATINATPTAFYVVKSFPFVLD